MREEYTLKIFENRVLRKISEPDREGGIASQNSIMRSFTICMPYHC
jgi:hypothetical protein